MVLSLINIERDIAKKNQNFKLNRAERIDQLRESFIVVFFCKFTVKELLDVAASRGVFKLGDSSEKAINADGGYGCFNRLSKYV
jgi:hypothetical protein